MTFTERMAQYIVNHSRSTMPEGVWEEGVKFFTDCFGCMIAGCTEENVRLLGEYAKEVNSQGACTLLTKTGGVKANAMDAARVNGAAAHVHDYDDNSASLCGHPSVAILPTVLAIGEETHANGEELVAAYILGIEVMVIFAAGLNPTAYQRGWHTTTQFGTFGATAAAGKLMGLDQEQLTMALGIAASMACGIRGNNGSMCKALQAGHANACGILAAKLAAKGFVSNRDAMEGNDNYIQAVTGTADFDAMYAFMDENRSAFTMPDMCLKLYPSCKCTSIGIDMARELQKKYGFQPEDVEHIVVGAQPFTIATLRYPEPVTSLQGKFSMGYNVALALVRGNVTMKDFEEPDITDRRVIDLMHRIEMVHDEDIAKGAYTNGTWETSIQIALKDGRVICDRQEQAYGDCKKPCTMEDMHEKFLVTSGYFLTKENSEKLYQMLVHPKTVADANDLMAFLSSAMSK